MILVDFDMPKNCRKCPIEGCIYHSVNETRPDLCPIVREVKRGRWILSRGDSLNFIKCTNCQGLSAEPVAHTVYPWNYCPYCGADMREDV